MPSKGGSKQQITGYKYFMAVHMGIARGPVNELTEIRVGDLIAWSGGATESSYQNIDQPNLFGGDEKEGGLTGQFKLLMGEPTQTTDDPFIREHLDGDQRVPGWRGVASLFYYGQIGSNNPYPKPWKIRVNRTTAGWDGDPWHPELAQISVTSAPLTTVSFNKNPISGARISINGEEIGFYTVAEGGFPGIDIGDSTETTVSRFAAVLNSHSAELFNVSATATGTTATLQFPAYTPVYYPADLPESFYFGTISQGSAGIKAMNPAHIIFECATNGVWGRGLPRNLIDEDSFLEAASTLMAEGFGMCLRWNRQEDIDKFVGTIVNHIGAALYFDRRTGLLTLNLIRQDYDADALEVYSFDNGILDITEDASTATDTTYNEIVVSYMDPISGRKGQVRVHNLASFQSLQTVISTNVDYLGCPTPSLALRLAQRDLQVNSSELRRLTIKMNRKAWRIVPGGVFRIHVPSRGIGSMILRAGNIEEGPLEEGTITITAIQDVFSLPTTSFVTPQPSFWVPSDNTAKIIDERLVGEITYYDLAATGADLSSVEVTQGAIKIFAEQPSPVTADYAVASKTTGEPEFEERSIAGFDAGAELTTPIGYYDTAITFEGGSRLDYVSAVGGPVLLVGESGEEYCRLDAFDPGGIATISRGVIDTIPHKFLAGEKIWFQTHQPTTDWREYSTSEVVQVKLLSRTSSQKLDPALADTDEVTIGGRQGRPYPPGNLTLNGVPVFNVHIVASGDLLFEWAHRDRIVQGNFLLEHGAGSTGPEAGTRYNIRVYDGADTTTLVRSVNETGTSWNYNTGLQGADGDLDSYWFEIESERDGLVSWQKYAFRISKSIDFNEGFNLNFNGGIP